MKRFLKRFALLLALLAISHCILAGYLVPVSMEEMLGVRQAIVVQRTNNYLKTGVPILYFGDSVLAYSSPEDHDPSPLSSILDRSLPELAVGSLDSGAYHVIVFEAYLEYIAEKKTSDLKLVIVPINLRSFSQSWQRRPKWQFNDLQRFLRMNGFLYRMSFRPLSIFRFYEDSDLTDDKFLEQPVYEGDTMVGTIQDVQATFGEDESAPVTYNYMQAIHRTHECTEALALIARTANNHNLEALFYVTPVDYQECVRRRGDEFSMQIQENIGTLTQVLAEQGHELLDLSRRLDSERFFYDPGELNEHLDEKGRRYVAEQLRVRILAQLQDAEARDANEDNAHFVGGGGS